MSVQENAVSHEDENNGEGGGPTVTIDQALELAQGHHGNGNFVIAERTYRDILRSVPDHYPTVYFMAALCYQRGNIPEAEEFAKKSVEADPEDVNCWVNYGSILSAGKKYEEALEAFEEALAMEPELYSAHNNKSYTLWLMKRYEEAEEAAIQATMVEPERVEAYINLGISLAAQEKYDEANDTWEQALEYDPENSMLYSNWSNSQREKGNLDEAKSKGEKAVEIDGRNHEAWSNLANACRDLGEYEEAIKNYKKAIDLKPDYTLAHVNQASTYVEANRFSEGVTSARFATSFDPDMAKAYYVLARAYYGLADYAEAYVAIDRACQLEPEDPLYMLTMAEMLVNMDSFDEAEAIIDKAVALNPSEPRALVALAEVKRGLDDVDGAIAVLDKVMNDNSATPGILLQKARILEYAAKLDEALECVEQVLSLNPDHPQALLVKADILLTGNRKKEASIIMEKAAESASDMPGYYANLVSYKDIKKDSPEYRKIQEYIEEGDTHGPAVQSSLYFATFNILEKEGDYEDAFEALMKGNELHAASKSRDMSDCTVFLNYMTESFTPEVMQSYDGLGSDSDLPVFIVGLPRSGTTLTEQIISSHREVFGAGELYDLQNIIRSMGPLSQSNADDMGQAYVDKIKARADSAEYKRITDKMPGNFQRIGFIKAILPNAKIIHCRRNPADNLLSCLKQNFAMGHEWTMNLETLANHYIAYHKMMQYWRENLPADSFLEIDYEETVTNLEDQARSLIDYIGLEWDEACLEPHRQKRAVLTASRDQVIKPVYKTSVDAWKRYEKQLQPMIQILSDAGVFQDS